MKRGILLLFLAGILALTLIGCNGGGGGSGGTTPAVGDTLTQEQRDRLWNFVFMGGGDFNDSTALYYNILFASYIPEQSSQLSMNIHQKSSTSLMKASLSEEWSGPDEGGWYINKKIYTFDTYIFIETTKFRYFFAYRRLEFSKIATQSDKPGAAEKLDGYLIFNSDPTVQNPAGVYPTSGTITFSGEWPPEDTTPDKIAFKMVFDGMNLVPLTSLGKAVMVGHVKAYVSYFDANDNKPDLTDKQIYDVNSTVNGADTDNPILHVAGTCDADGDLWTDGDKSFEQTFSLSLL